MAQRIFTALIGLVVFFTVLFSNVLIFQISICIVTIGMLYEIYRSTQATRSLRVVGIISTALIVVGFFTNNIIPYIFLSIVLYMTTSVFLHGKFNFKDVYASGFITWFITFFMMNIVFIRSQYGVSAVLIVFICAWMTDTSAYFVGIFLGKHKLIPNVSPKKTIEGSIGGLLGAILSCIIYAFILIKLGVINSSTQIYIQFSLLGLFGSALSQIGDLIASAIKRDCNVKDFGTIFPGHGGILDRFDSVLFVSPIIYYLISYFNLFC